MTKANPALEGFSKFMALPPEELKELWSQGQDITIGSNVDLKTSNNLEQKTFFITEGILREFVVDNNGTEHTLSIIQGPAVVSPTLNDVYSKDNLTLQSQSLTPLIGKLWGLKINSSDLLKNPLCLNARIRSVINAVKVKVIKDIRRQECSTQDRYELFVKEFPGAVNLIPLKHIASYLNMSPETISRIRKKLSKPYHEVI